MWDKGCCIPRAIAFTIQSDKEAMEATHQVVEHAMESGTTFTRPIESSKASLARIGSKMFPSSFLWFFFTFACIG